MCVDSSMTPSEVQIVHAGVCCLQDKIMLCWNCHSDVKGCGEEDLPIWSPLSIIVYLFGGSDSHIYDRIMDLKAVSFTISLTDQWSSDLPPLALSSVQLLCITTRLLLCSSHWQWVMPAVLHGAPQSQSPSPWSGISRILSSPPTTTWCPCPIWLTPTMFSSTPRP